MFGISWKLLGLSGLTLALALGWALRLDHLRAGWKDQFETLQREAKTVVLALQEASGNRKLEWKDAPGQAIALGEDKRRLERDIAEQNARLDEMAAEAVRLRARASELRRIAEKAEAQRKAALRGLSDMAATPGTREDCMTLLKEAEAALDIVYKAGV